MAKSSRDKVIAACSAKPGSIEDYPFSEGAAVFKVAGKIFAIVDMDGSAGSVSLKCDPDLAIDLRRRYEAITAGYHLNKRHWNTIAFDGSVPDDEVLDLVHQSYELVVAGLPKGERDKLSALYRGCGGAPRRGGAGAASVKWCITVAFARF